MSCSFKIANQIKNGYNEIKEIDGQVVIYGKKGHAEVTGLFGQTNGNAIIVESLNDIDKIDFQGQYQYILKLLRVRNHTI